MKNTRKLLVSSMIMILSCCLLFAGTTFAWFSDSVTSDNNIIAAGNLDVAMYWADGTANPEDASWTEASTGPIFNYDKWEPGYAVARHIKISNEGTLALKYKLTITPDEEVSELADVIDVYYADPAVQLTGRDKLDSKNKLGTLRQVLENLDKTALGTLSAGDSDVVTLVLKMQETAGNEYQGKSIGTSFSVKLYATQVNSEKDSFDNNYDAGDEWLGDVDTDWYNTTASEFTLYSAEELAGLALLVNEGEDNFKGKTIKLGSNLNLNNVEWTPIGTNKHAFVGDFDGQNYTIYNLKVDNEGWAGIFGHVGINVGSTIENLKVENATINSNRMAGTIVGQIYGNVVNCHVKNTKINVIPNEVEGGYDNGDKVGGIVGWIGDNNNNRLLDNNTVETATINGYRDLGGIAGYVAYSTTVSNNKVSKVTVSADQRVNNYGYKDPNVGAVYGRTSGVITDENNTSVEASATAYYVQNGLVLYSDGTEVMLYLVPADFAGDTVIVPEGVTTIGGYSFYYSKNVKKAVLSSTVKKLADKAFNESSLTEVVLNEGLEVIGSRAFRRTYSLKSLVIPSTVTTIVENAFQNAAIESLVIPASVKEIGEGGFQGMANLERVVIEGNTYISDYAFRACPKLHTVILKGEGITFQGTNMVFCNKESGLAPELTVYVTSEQLKDKVLKGDSSSKYYKALVVMSNVKDAKELDEALLAGDSSIFLPSDFTFSASETNANSGYGATGLTLNGGVLDGVGHTLTVNNANGTWDCAINPTSGTIQNLTVSGAMRGIFMGSATGDVYINNVVFDDVIYTFNSDGGNKKYGVYISNSTLNGWTSYSNVHKEVVFTDCNFGEGCGYAFLRAYNSTKFTNCNFDEGFEVQIMAGATAIFENCYINGVLITSENIESLLDSTPLDYVTVK